MLSILLISQVWRVQKVLRNRLFRVLFSSVRLPLLRVMFSSVRPLLLRVMFSSVRLPLLRVMFSSVRPLLLRVVMLNVWTCGSVSVGMILRWRYPWRVIRLNLSSVVGLLKIVLLNVWTCGSVSVIKRKGMIPWRPSSWDTGPLVALLDGSMCIIVFLIKQIYPHILVTQDLHDIFFSEKKNEMSI